MLSNRFLTEINFTSLSRPKASAPTNKSNFGFALTFRDKVTLEIYRRTRKAIKPTLSRPPPAALPGHCRVAQGRAVAEASGISSRPVRSPLPSQPHFCFHRNLQVSGGDSAGSSPRRHAPPDEPWHRARGSRQNHDRCGDGFAPRGSLAVPQGPGEQPRLPAREQSRYPQPGVR